MQRVTPGVRDSFGPVEDALKETFVLVLFKGLREGVPERGVTCLPVKQAGLALPDPSQTAPENCTTSCVVTGHLVSELRGQVEFRMADHSACLQEGRTAVRSHGQIRAEEALTSAREGGPVLHTHRLRRAAKTGAWLIVQPSTVNGVELGAWFVSLNSYKSSAVNGIQSIGIKSNNIHGYRPYIYFSYTMI